MPCCRQGGGLAHSALHDVQQMLSQFHRLLRRHECSEGAAIAGIARLEELNRDWMYGAGNSANSWLYALQRPRPLLAEFLVNSHVLSSVMPRRNGATMRVPCGAYGAVGQPLGCESPRYLDECITYALIVLFGKAVPVHCLKYDS